MSQRRHHYYRPEDGGDRSPAFMLMDDADWPALEVTVPSAGDRAPGLGQPCSPMSPQEPPIDHASYAVNTNTNALPKANSHEVSTGQVKLAGGCIFIPIRDTRKKHNVPSAQRTRDKHRKRTSPGFLSWCHRHTAKRNAPAVQLPTETQAAMDVDEEAPPPDSNADNPGTNESPSGSTLIDRPINADTCPTTRNAAQTAADTAGPSRGADPPDGSRTQNDNIVRPSRSHDHNVPTSGSMGTTSTTSTLTDATNNKLTSAR